MAHNKETADMPFFLKVIIVAAVLKGIILMIIGFSAQDLSIPFGDLTIGRGDLIAVGALLILSVIGFVSYWNIKYSSGK